MNGKNENKKWFSSLGMRYFVGSLIFMALQIVGGMVFGAILPEEVYAKYSLLIGMLPAYIIGVPVMALIITKNNPGVKVGEEGFKKSLVVKAFFACITVMYVGNIISTMLNSLIASVVGGSGQNALAAVLSGSTLLQQFLIVVIAAPILEEILFRKLLVDRLAKYGQGIAILVSALTFGFYHGNIIQFVYATMMGIILAYVYVKSGKLRYPIILHILLNFWGSIVPLVVLQVSNMGELVEMTAGAAPSQEVMMSWMMQNIGGLLLYFGFIVLQFGFVITGIVMLCLNLKKAYFSLKAGEITLERGTRFKTIVCNPGVLLFILLWVGMMIYTVCRL